MAKVAGLENVKNLAHGGGFPVPGECVRASPFSN